MWILSTPDQMAGAAYQDHGAWVEQSEFVGQMMNVTSVVTADVATAVIMFPHRLPEKLPLVRVQKVFVCHTVIYANRISICVSHEAAAHECGFMAE